MEIHERVKAGELEAVTKYLAGGGDIEAQAPLAGTLLHVAAENGRVKIVELLLAKGAVVDAPNYCKSTPVDRAAGHGVAVVVRALLDAGAAATARTSFATTPLHEIAAGGASAKAKDRVAIVRPPAVMTARLAVVKRLLDLGADPQRRAACQLGSPLDAARGLHQRKQYRIAWPQAVALLER